MTNDSVTSSNFFINFADEAGMSVLGGFVELDIGPCLPILGRIPFLANNLKVVEDEAFDIWCSLVVVLANVETLAHLDRYRQVMYLAL